MVEDYLGMMNVQLQTNYNYALLKRSMEDMEAQAMSLINDMVAAVPAPASVSAPAQYNFDVWA